MERSTFSRLDTGYSILNTHCMETRQCQNCKQSFAVEAEDFAFYEKVGVPAPTFCPGCRMQRRMARRNERALYKRVCDTCGKSIICVYPKKIDFQVYCATCWWGDFWDPMSYGMEYDFSKSFFFQFKELQNRVPRPYANNTSSGTMLNSEYTNCAGEMKNCYLVYGALRDEDCAYAHYLNDSRYCFDILYGFKSEYCYECFDIESCYNVRYSQSCVQCRDAYFLFDCRNCSDCIACIGLRNKKYCFFNQEYTKEEYEQKKALLALRTRSGIESLQKEFQDIYYSSPRKYYHGQMNNGFSGDYITSCENVLDSYYIKQSRGCKFVFWCNKAEDVYDYMSWGDMQLSYECVSNGGNSYHSRFTDACWDNNKELEYCSLCFNSSSLFGCIGLNKKQYCILNKQYTEDEYAKLRERIIGEMIHNPYKDKRGVSYFYGEFFPVELSPFLYMDTVAQEHFPMTKDEIVQNGYQYEESEKRDYAITMRGVDLPDSIQEVEDTILRAVIGCVHQGTCKDQCTEAFRITPEELRFYREFGIPLPQLCYNCRHARRVNMRNPLKLWKRKCQCGSQHQVESIKYRNAAEHFHGEGVCPSEFETAYAPERPEIVYCEQCYQAEVA